MIELEDSDRLEIEILHRCKHLARIVVVIERSLQENWDIVREINKKLFLLLIPH